MMQTLLIILNEMPYKNDRAFNALRLAGSAAEQGTAVTMFLMGDAVYLARKGQKPQPGMADLEEMTTKLLQTGVKVKLCTTCVKARGYAPTDEDVAACFVGSSSGEGIGLGDLIPGAELSTMPELTSLIASSEKVVSF